MQDIWAEKLEGDSTNTIKNEQDLILELLNYSFENYYLYISDYINNFQAKFNLHLKILKRISSIQFW